ncbi:MAG: hypothetical protein M3383_00770 [Actinomycetota bacterium]|nr:hypothetical protein [Actinomycetota bacterium]
MSGRLKRFGIATSVAACTAAIAIGPGTANAGPVEDALNGVKTAVNDALSEVGGGAAAPAPAPAPAAGVPPTYTPPLHGTNPHGQGTVGVIDLSPEDFEPLPYDPDGGSEDSVIGRSRGEQNPDGSYHGHITLVSTFLTGEIIGCDTNEGEQCTGPLGAINEQTCDLNGGGVPGSFNLCVLAMNSETDENGSTNGFQATAVNLGGDAGITARAAGSNGNISDDGECQTAHGDSNVANASIGGELTAEALSSSSDSTACNDGSETVTNDSEAVNLAGNTLPVPPGCETGEPNSNFDPLLPLLGAVCHADDVNGSTADPPQTDSPYGVREALSLFVLDLGGVPLLKTTTAAAESHAVAPGEECPDPTNPDCPPPPCPDPANPDCPPECPDPGNPDCPPDCPDPDDPRCPTGPDCPDVTNPDCPDGPGGPSGDGPDDDSLPFTGADMATLALVGLGVMGGGLALMAASDRRRRLAVE